jgi:phosphopantetheine--protein transferase-like protein
MIIGLGVDIAEVGRVKAAIERHGKTFLRRVYTHQEIEYCEGFRNKYERYAGRFAAKEAAMKALGTGWRRGSSARARRAADDRLSRRGRENRGAARGEAHCAEHHAHRDASVGAGDLRELTFLCVLSGFCGEPLHGDVTRLPVMRDARRGQSLGPEQPSLRARGLGNGPREQRRAGNWRRARG